MPVIFSLFYKVYLSMTIQLVCVALHSNVNKISAEANFFVLLNIALKGKANFVNFLAFKFCKCEHFIMYVVK